MNPPLIPPGLTVLHQDTHLLVADKPAGLLCVPGRGPDKADCLAARVMAACPDALVVHRLDMGTSGLVVFGRGAEMQRQLNKAFANRQVHKRYEAVLAGLVLGDEGQVDLPLITDWPNRPRQMVNHQIGKPSLTRWRVMSRDEVAGTTRVSLEPVTGRSHQLRVHMAAMGHAIVGDELYAPPQWADGQPRLLLHACELALDDVTDAGPQHFASPPPF